MNFISKLDYIDFGLIYIELILIYKIKYERKRRRKLNNSQDPLSNNLVELINLSFLLLNNFNNNILEINIFK